MSKHSHENNSITRKNKSRTIPGPLVRSLKVTQDEYDTEKDNKVSSSVEVSKHEYICVTPHPLLKTPLPFDNKRDYKGDTHDETPDSITKYTKRREKRVTPSKILVMNIVKDIIE